LTVKHRALRLVLAQAAAKAAEEAFVITGRSINDLPEYFLSVFIARYIQQHYKSFTFSMEDSVSSICEDLSLDARRIERPGKVDIAIRSQKRGGVKHLIELKRAYGEKGHVADIERLADFCMLAPEGHSLSTNYMVLVTAATPYVSELREVYLREYVNHVYRGNISLKREQIKLSPSLKSTRKGKTEHKPLSGEVWEVSCCG